MTSIDARRARRKRVLVWLLAAPTVAAALGASAIEAWHMFVRLAGVD